VSIDYTKILSTKYATDEWTLDGDNYSGLTWLSDTPKPSQKTLDDLWPEVQAQLQADKENKAAEKQALLDRLGITADEAALLLS
jgi:hypothetical protein